MKQVFVIMLLGLLGNVLGNTTQLTQKRNAKKIQKRQEGISVVCDNTWGQVGKIKKTPIKNLTQKALLMPAPEYPLTAKEQQITGTVMAEVIIDIQMGKILRAQIKSGHPLLQTAVAKVVCQATFPATQYDGPTVYVGVGVLKYNFTLP